MNKDQVKGRAKEVEGKAKEILGKLGGSKKQEVEGKVEKNIGKGQATFGDLKDKLRK
ncbi:MAG: CsbD family protein [Acidithiobacillus sp.]